MVTSNSSFELPDCKKALTQLIQAKSLVLVKKVFCVITGMRSLSVTWSNSLSQCCACLRTTTVSPPLQGDGIGKQLLEAAQETWGINKAVMTVIACRNELIAFYQRRGYRLTGVNKEFPASPELWTPKVADLRLEVLEKVL